MPTLQRLHTTVSAPGAGLSVLRNRLAGYPGALEKAIYPLADANVATSVADAILGNPSTAGVTQSGGVVANLSVGSGAQILGRAAIPQAVGTEINITQAWTIWSAIKVKSGSGTVWTLFQDYNFFSGGHGFWVFSQSGGAVADGAQIGITVRMTNDGVLDFGSDYNLALPPNPDFTYGKWMLLSVSHDGIGNITIQVWASNGKVAQATKFFTIDKGRGPVGSKTSTTRWQVGTLSPDFVSPGIELEGWGVLQRQWTDSDALKAYRNARATALARGRRWT